MRRVNHAFTLIELLVVIGIISIVAAILFPVFSGARGMALRTACASNLHQISLGALAYASDYDDRLMPVNYQPIKNPTSRNDRTWVQLELPYVTSFDLFRCPADYSERPSPEATFDQDLVPGDTDSQYYTASLRSDYGYNYQNLAPIILTLNGWTAEPHDRGEIANQSNTILFMDSVWSRLDNGTPFGGGNWLVVPPCRFYAPAGPGEPKIDSFTGARNVHTQVYTTAYGWAPDSESASNVYGDAWPWHLGRVNVVEVDGSIRSLSPTQLAVGCELKGNWQGTIQDSGAYMWDLQ